MSYQRKKFLATLRNFMPHQQNYCHSMTFFSTKDICHRKKFFITGRNFLSHVEAFLSRRNFLYRKKNHTMLFPENPFSEKKLLYRYKFILQGKIYITGNKSFTRRNCIAKSFPLNWISIN